MIAARRCALVVLVLAGCGGAPVAPTRDESVTLLFRPPLGARYLAHLVVQTTARSGGRARVTSDVALEVVEVDPSFATLRAHLVGERVELPDHPVRLPPMERTERADVDMRIDEHGWPIGTPFVVAAAASPPLGGFVWGAPAYPVRSVRVGELWAVPFAFASVGESPEGTRTGAFRLDEVQGGRAHVSWTIQSSVSPADHAGTPAHGALAVEGFTWLALADGVPRTGAVEVTARWEEPPDELLPQLPASVQMSWCVAREGEPPCAPDAQAPDDPRPVARAYEGEQCTSRVAALATSLGSVPVVLYEQAPAEHVAVVDHGTEAISGPALRIEIARDGAMQLDGRAMPNATAVLRGIEDLRRQWATLHDGEVFPERVRLVAAAAAPLSAVVRVIHAVGRSLTIELLVDTGRRREIPTTPAWVEAAMGSVGPEGREAQVASALVAAIAGCAPLAEAVGALASLGAAERDRALRRALPRQVAACHCRGVDIDAIEALLFRPTVGSGEGLAVLVLPPATGAPTLVVPRNGSVTDLARTLAARPTPSAAVHVRLH